MTALRGSGIAVAVFLYTRLLCVCPPAFRAAYGRDMALMFRDRCLAARARSGARGLLVCCAGGLVNLVAGGVRERLLERRRRVRAFIRRRGAAGAHDEPARGDSMPQTVRQDLRFAARNALRHPAFAATVALTLALGIGATSVIFSLVDATLLKPLPFRAPDGLFSILVTTSQREYARTPVSPANLPDLRRRIRSFTALAGFSSSWQLRLTLSGDPAFVNGQYVSAGLFDLLGVGPVEGRDFLPSEHLPNGPAVAIVSRAFWRQHFGPHTPLVRQVLQLDSRPYSIIGIMPDGFRLPFQASIVNQRAGSAELWLPFSLNPYAASRRVPVMNVVGRLAPAVTAAQARTDLDAAAAGLARDYPDTSAGQGLVAVPLHEEVAGRIEATLVVLFAAVAFLALIACANVANLLLARGVSRARELSVRSALGASRRRLVQELLTESLLYAIAGGLLGLLAAYVAIRALPLLDLPGMPRVTRIAMDYRVAAFDLALAVATALVSGLLPALQMSRQAASESLKESSRTVTGAGRRLRSAIVVGEVALAIVLLVGAGLLLRSFWDLSHVNPGFRTEHLAEFGVAPTPVRFPTAARRRVYMDDLLQRLSRLPGVDRAAGVNRLPLSGSNTLVGIEIDGRPAPAGSGGSPVDRRVATPGYFRVMGIPLADGRAFDERDRSDAPLVAIVNEQMSRQYWPDGRPLGRRLRLALLGGPGPWLTVVGVTGNVRHHGLGAPAHPEIYVPYAQAPVESMTMVLQTPVEPQSLLGSVRAQVWAVDPDQPIDDVASLSSVVSESVAAPRFRMLLVNTFAALALVLAAVGIYGVIWYSVSRRAPDIGLRMALGAGAGDIVRMIVREGLALASGGLAIGLLMSVMATRLLRALLFDVGPTDPITYATVAALLLAVAGVASYLPARRATRIDPIEALRSE